MNNIKVSHVFIIILVLNLLLFILSYGKFGMFFVDTSREVYIPFAMNHGAVLYKDIFNVYSPLGYQLNALVTHIFSDNLSVYYILGFVNSCFFLWGVFLLLKIFIKNNQAVIFSFLLLILCSCIYSVSLTNYIFPYSYSMIYALSCFTYVLVFFLKYLQTNKTCLLYFSMFLYGMCLSFRYEFITYLLVLGFALILKKPNLKEIFGSLFFLLMVPCLSLMNLFLNGVTLFDLKEACRYIVKLSSADSVIELYKFLGFIPSFASSKLLFSFFVKALIFVSVISGLLFLISKFLKKKVIGCSILFIIGLVILTPVFVESNAFFFNWSGIFSVLLFGLFLVLYFKSHYSKDYELFLVLFASVLAVSIKSICNIAFNSYGTYYFPLIMLCVVLFFVKFLSKKMKTSIVFILLFTGSLYLFSNIERRQITYTDKIQTEKGTIFVPHAAKLAISQVLKYIKENTKPTDKIVVMPEGAMINFLSGRISDNNYFYLIPPNIEIFNEDKIVEKLSENLPDYIIIQSLSYGNFHKTFFCESFGKKICTLIPNYYKEPVVFGDIFWIVLYKRDENTNKEL